MTNDAVKGKITTSRAKLAGILDYLFSGGLDAFTSYGAHLLWPFDESRIRFTAISVIGPIFTMILLIAVLYAFIKHTKVATQVGLVLAALYLVFGRIKFF